MIEIIVGFFGVCTLSISDNFTIDKRAIYFTTFTVLKARE
jgi:hypothetical protein